MRELSQFWENAIGRRAPVGRLTPEMGVEGVREAIGRAADFLAARDRKRVARERRFWAERRSVVLAGRV